MPWQKRFLSVNRRRVNVLSRCLPLLRIAITECFIKGIGEGSIALLKGIKTMHDLQISDEDIAIIGMSGRFPGAKDIGEYWQKLCDGVECIGPGSGEQMRKALRDSLGYVPETLVEQWLKDPRYVKAASALEDIDLFDAEFFGYTAAEVELLDPQQRLF